MRANLCTVILQQTRGVLVGLPSLQSRRGLCLAGVLLCLLAFGVQLAVAADPPRQETVILAFDADLPTMDPHMHILRTGVITFYHSFLGLGIQPPTPSWGGMLGEGKDYMLLRWWLATFPGLAIFVTTLLIHLVGDGLRDWLDPATNR